VVWRPRDPDFHPLFFAKSIEVDLSETHLI
jgi:hypothetical protein